MGRDFQIPGECMVQVKGASDSVIPSLIQLGLTADPIEVTLIPRTKDINVDAWGGMEGAPADVQQFLAWAYIDMTLIHYDPVVLDAIISLANGTGGANFVNPNGGLMFGHTGQRFGGGALRFAAGNRYIGLNITSPANARPWRFLYAYVADSPRQWPLGTEKSVVPVRFRAIPYTDDPWGNAAGAQSLTAAGTGSLGAVLYDRVLDT